MATPRLQNSSSIPTPRVVSPSPLRRSTRGSEPTEVTEHSPPPNEQPTPDVPEQHKKRRAMSLTPQNVSVNLFREISQRRYREEQVLERKRSLESRPPPPFLRDLSKKGLKRRSQSDLYLHTIREISTPSIPSIAVPLDDINEQMPPRSRSPSPSILVNGYPVDEGDDDELGIRARSKSDQSCHDSLAKSKRLPSRTRVNLFEALRPSPPSQQESTTAEIDTDNIGTVYSRTEVISDEMSVEVSQTSTEPSPLNETEFKRGSPQRDGRVAMFAQKRKNERFAPMTEDSATMISSDESSMASGTATSANSNDTYDVKKKDSDDVIHPPKIRRDEVTISFKQRSTSLMDSNRIEIYAPTDIALTSDEENDESNNSFDGSNNSKSWSSARNGRQCAQIDLFASLIRTKTTIEDDINISVDENNKSSNKPIQSPKSTSPARSPAFLNRDSRIKTLCGFKTVERSSNIDQNSSPGSSHLSPMMLSTSPTLGNRNKAMSSPTSFLTVPDLQHSHLKIEADDSLKLKRRDTEPPLHSTDSSPQTPRESLNNSQDMSSSGPILNPDFVASISRRSSRGASPRARFNSYQVESWV